MERTTVGGCTKGTLKTLLIVYHSMTGGTEQMARAAAAGADGASGIRINLSRAHETVPADVIAADGFVFATPENLASMSGLMKDFFDRSYYPALERLNGRPYASLICAGSDGSSAAAQIARIATGWRLREVAPPLIVCTHAQTPEAILKPKHIGAEQLAACRELGATLGHGIAMGIF
jgi:multimeric flavodoxin WrbA